MFKNFFKQLWEFHKSNNHFDFPEIEIAKLLVHENPYQMSFGGCLVGEAVGDIHLDHRVDIGIKGKIKGKIIGKGKNTVKLYGQVKGTIAAEMIIITESAVIYGDIWANQLRIAEGAYMDGTTYLGAYDSPSNPHMIS